MGWLRHRLGVAPGRRLTAPEAEAPTADDPAPTPLSEEELAAEGGVALPAKEVVSILDLAVDLAAPVDLAVAANANVAAPIDAAVVANAASVDSQAVAVAQQHAIITQNIEGSAEATSDQQSDIQQ